MRLVPDRRAPAAAHLDSDPTNNQLKNLRALCQRCQMLHDRPHHLAQRWITYRRRSAGGDLFLGPYPAMIAPSKRTSPGEAEVVSEALQARRAALPRDRIAIKAGPWASLTRQTPTLSRSASLAPALVLLLRIAFGLQQSARNNAAGYAFLSVLSCSMMPAGILIARKCVLQRVGRPCILSKSDPRRRVIDRQTGV